MMNKNKIERKKVRTADLDGQVGWEILKFCSKYFANQFKSDAYTFIILSLYKRLTFEL